MIPYKQIKKWSKTKNKDINLDPGTIHKIESGESNLKLSSVEIYLKQCGWKLVAIPDR